MLISSPVGAVSPRGFSNLYPDGGLVYFLAVVLHYFLFRLADRFL